MRPNLHLKGVAVHRGVPFLLMKATILMTVDEFWTFGWGSAHVLPCANQGIRASNRRPFDNAAIYMVVVNFWTGGGG